jgi:peptide/nickel transport system substrate-binding protein
MGLTQALDLGQLASVATAGAGGPATTLAAIEPVSCPGDSVSGSLPAQDAEAAKAPLAGKKLTFIYSSAAGSAMAAAAELAVQEWKAAGADVTAKGVDETALQGVIFGSGDWDIAWVPLNVNSPDQLVPFLSGPGLADQGTNFSGIDNKDYTDGVAAANAMNGTDGCQTWLDAESKLVAAADIVPFANNEVKTFGNGAEFDYPGTFMPTSIRMLAK